MLAVFLDIETTGLDPHFHAVIDIGIEVVDLQSGEALGLYQAVVKQSRGVWDERDPVSISINGYSFEDLQKGKEPDRVKKEIIAFLNGCGVVRHHAFFICQNPGFDRGFFDTLVDVYTQEKLNWPYHWLDLASMFWAKLKPPFPETINLSKNSIAKYFHLPAEVQPHRAVNGVKHLIRCYEAVLGVTLKDQPL